nr:MAG: capsid protein [Cressdnaviricota sp.]
MAFRRTTRRRTHTYPRRHSRTRTRVRRGAAITKRVAKLWQDAELDRPPKHIIYSNQSVSGATSLQWGTLTSGLTNGTPIKHELGLMQRQTTVQGRLADYIFWSRLKFHFRIYYGSGVQGDQCLKYFVICERTPAGSPVSAANFCLDYYGVNNPDTNTLPNINNKTFSARYRILKQGTVWMRQSVSGVVEQRELNLDLKFKKPIKSSLILGTTGTVTDYDANLISVLWIADSVSGGANQIGINFEGCMWFRDQV